MNGVARRALFVGFGALGVIIPLYLTLGSTTGHPLAAFAVPPLLTAVVGHSRSTVVVGAVSLAFAVVFGIVGPMSAPAVAARIVVNTSLIATAAFVARMREREHAEVVQLAETSALYHVFESGLLPAPHVPLGFDVIVRFVSSEHQMTLGGDLVDALDLPDGRLAVIIGDVCGHGPRQAAFATAVRAGWRTVVRTHGPDPSMWLAHLRRTLYPGVGDRATGMSTIHDLPYVTLCTGIVDRGTAEITLAVAGHPPPLTVGRHVRAVELHHGPPLGLDVVGEWRALSVPIGDGLLFYTDGLVDNPSRHGPADRWGESGLVARVDKWCREHSIPSTHVEREDLASGIVEAAQEARELRDDLALMIVALATTPDGHTRAMAN